MRIFMQWFFAIIFILCNQTSAQQAVGRIVDGTIFPGITTNLQNLIQNPSARLNAASGTATSSATLTRDTSTAANKLDGIASFICDASAQNGYCEFNTYTIPEGYKTGNCMGGFQYKGDASLYRIQITDGTNVVSQGTYTLGNVTDWTWATINYPCGATRKIRATQTEVGTAPAFNLGQVTWSIANNLSTLNNVSDWTSWTPTGSLTTNTTYSGYYKRVGDHGYFRVLISFGGANTQGTVTVNLPTGLSWDTGKMLKTTNDYRTMGRVSSADVSVTTYSGSVTYNSTTVVTINYHHTGVGGANNAVNFNNVSSSTPEPWTAAIASGDFILAEFDGPISGWSGSTVYTPEVRNWRIDASIGGALIGLNTTDTGYNTPASATLTLTNFGTINGNITCSGTNPPGTTTCPAGSEETGINFDITEAQRVRVCAQFGEEVDTNAAGQIYSNWRWEETASNSQTGIQSCGPQITGPGVDGGSAARDDLIFPQIICAECAFTTNGNKTLRLKNAVEANGTINAHNIHATTDGGVDGRVRITVEPVGINVPAPVLFGGANWVVDSKITGAGQSLGTTSTAVFAGIENAAFTMTNSAQALVAKIPCSSTNPPTGTTCAAGNESFGTNFDLPNAGWVEACTDFTHQITGNTSQALATLFKIVETPSSSQSILQEGIQIYYSGSATNTFTYNQANAYHFCSQLYFPSAGNKTLRLFYDTEGAGTATSNQISCDGGAGAAQRTCTFTVRPLLSGPVTVNVSALEYQETKSSSSVNFGASNATSDLTSITLTAGEWDCTGIGVMSATASVTDLRYGISTTSGNSTTGLVNGDNYFFDYAGSSTFNKTFIIPNYRVVHGATTTYYFKIRATYGGSTPAVESHKLSCRRFK